MKKLWKRCSYAIILFAVSFAAALILSIRFDAFQHNHYMKVTISDGDSLWKIANNYKKQSLSSEEFVKWVQRHNHIDADHIYPGQKILIPVSRESRQVNELAGAAKD